MSLPIDDLRRFGNVAVRGLPRPGRFLPSLKQHRSLEDSLSVRRVIGREDGELKRLVSNMRLGCSMYPRDVGGYKNAFNSSKGNIITKAIYVIESLALKSVVRFALRNNFEAVMALEAAKVRPQAWTPNLLTRWGIGSSML